MTSRTADYHIFGQNQHLAAGMVTAFCSAVVEKYGAGNSCFVGLNGWNQTQDKDPPPNPYCGVAPGIFQVRTDYKAGPLGTKEQAIIIGDLDLVNTTEQRPRPHFSNPPLSLVAHLPLIFATERRPDSSATPKPDGVWAQRYVRYRVVRPHAGGTDATVSTFSAQLSEFEAALRSFERARQAGVRSLSEQLVATALQWMKTLELFADDSKWIENRADVFKENIHLLPVNELPAALVDWIWIDDSWPTDERTLEHYAAPRPDDALADDRPYLNI